jgi:hypothetical protein
VARARILEWRLRDLEGALEVVEAALRFGGDGGPFDDDLERRRLRLRRRLERRQRRRSTIAVSPLPLLSSVEELFPSTRPPPPTSRVRDAGISLRSES